MMGESQQHFLEHLAEVVQLYPETVTGRGGLGGKGIPPFPPVSTFPTLGDETEETSVTEEPKTERARNVVWDACEEALGYGPLTESEKRLWGRMTTSLSRAGADADKISAVASWYRRHWPEIDLTITAIEKWYSHFLAKSQQKDRRSAPKNSATDIARYAADLEDQGK